MANKKIIITIILFFVVIEGGLLFYKFTKEKEDRGKDGVFCTMEALLCPDGSYVGRSGPQCQFSRCPEMSLIVGTLRQNQNDFSLIMSSPDNNAMDVSYVMPVVFQSGDVSGLVGKKVKISGYFMEGNKFYVAKIEKTENDDPSLGEVGVGKSVYINGVKITLNRVVQDSRCPIDAQCIEGGAINANVTLQSSTDKETRNMPSDEVPISFDSYKISIEKISPPRLSNSEPDPLSYQLTFRVRENK